MIFNVYMLDGCPYCTKTINLLNKKNLQYNEKTIERNKLRKYKKKYNSNTFPIVILNYENKRYNIGGYNDLKKFLKDIKPYISSNNI